jgi:hypothetical protein
MYLILNKYIMACVLALSAGVAGAAFDQQHAAWTAILKQHVVLIDGGKASALRYGTIARERGALQSYLATLASVPESEFGSWSRNAQLAFLINAYNAHMIALVLTRYPDMRSVWDFGKLLDNPFRKRFFRLLGREMSLDRIEHETIRAKGRYDDPRIHMAVNCASVGCPMLREEAYVGERLDAQLDEQVARFLSDRSRNRYNAADGVLEVSELFKWYREDFERGYRGIVSREQFLAAYAAQLADSPGGQQAIRERRAALRYLDYDWRLNDAKS